MRDDILANTATATAIIAVGVWGDDLGTGTGTRAGVLCRLRSLSHCCCYQCRRRIR